MKKTFILITVLLSTVIFAQGNFRLSSAEEQKINELTSKMTLDEKIGQLVQIVGAWEADESMIRKGNVGSFILGVHSLERANHLQKIAVEESRLGIPLIFANDIIHGYTTTFPVPLAEASSWNPELVSRACAIAAFEAASEGTKWTYAPMVDIARDPRWGRIMEGSGEDPYLGSVMASARVKGFQGNDLKDRTKVAACAKHYVAYGAAEGGRDYNTVDISERTLREIYLPPFHSAVKSGALSIMSAFNDLDGVPASANYFTLTEILRNEWKWDGVVISDYNSIGELVKHRFAKDKKDAALKGFSAGVDIDMVGDSADGDVYSPYLSELVRQKLIPLERINESVRRVLKMKFRLGLFDNPYTDSMYFRKTDPGKAYKDSIALELARESIVLLKNQDNILPIKKEIKQIAVIGPLADSQKDMLGSWAGTGKPENVITLLQGIRNIAGGRIRINYSKGCNINDNDTSGFREAIDQVKQSEVVIIAAGEGSEMTGEASSRSNINIPGIQEELIKRVYSTGVPVIVVLFSGRPLTIDWAAENIPGIIEAWFLGNQSGNAIADVLFGKYNPSGKLPVTFPRSTGQIPLYYAQKSTGRPVKAEDKYTSKYLDIPNSPLFPFGHGLSYTTFSYKDINVNKTRISKTDSLIVTVGVSNTGTRDGDEVVQLYIQDEVSSVTRPVKELKGVRKIRLMPGETKNVSFSILPEMLSFLDKDNRPVIEPGKFNIMIGGSSAETISASFEVAQEQY